MRWTPRCMALIASLALTVASVDLVITAPAMAADFGTRLSYTCAAGKGRTHKVVVRFSGSAPKAGVTGKAIRLGAITVKAKLPVALVGQVLGPQLGQITGTAQARVKVGQVGQGSIDAQWPEFTVAAARVPDSGPVELMASGAVPSVVPAVAGDVIFTAGSLSLKLEPAGPGRTQARAGDAAKVKCTPDRAVQIAVVKTAGASPSGVAAPGQAPSAPADGPRCDVPALDLNPEFIMDPPDNGGTTIPNEGGQARCGQAIGYSTLRKVGASAAMATRLRVRTPRRHRRNAPNGWQMFEHAVLNDTLPTKATVLGFGFMPTRVTTSIQQIGTAYAADISKDDDGIPPPSPPLPYPGHTGFAKARLRVEANEANINGVPLSLGSGCSSTVLLRLRTDYWKSQSDILRGSILYTPTDSRLVVPPFEHCGTGEDLSPLLTASTSGGGNDVRIQQGALCPPETDLSDCAERPQVWIVDPGGVVNVKFPGYSIRNSTTKAVIKCTSAAARLALPEGEVFGGSLGRLAITPEARTCTGPGGTGPVNFFTPTMTLTAVAQDYDSSSGISRIVSTTGVGLSIRFPGANSTGTCQFSTTAQSSPAWNIGYSNGYSNEGQRFTFRPRKAARVATASGNCGGLFAVGDEVVVDEITVPMPTDQKHKIIARPA